MPAEVSARSAAPDREVLRMQPLALADGWGADREETIRLQNETDAVVVLVVERVRWNPHAITAEAMANPLFRRVRGGAEVGPATGD